MAITPALPASPSPYFEIIALPKKGLGAIATTTIPANTLLFSEPPLLWITHSPELEEAEQAEHVNTAFAALSGALQTLFLSLAGGVEAGVEGAWKCNNFMLTSDGRENAVFAAASRINHSCNGGENAYWRWEGGKGRIEFWSGRRVEEGEEITHCYRPDWRMGTRNRRLALLEEYGFVCGCVVCEEQDD
ncbi:SET domain-containing protein [Choiromyces venosus 120613-1]|uniref:SET domain-containing protein n=1 Tax=Choiromyces venosus 120613-1 TaxID=1336337 RepID=A0A3N4JFQ0_9PEZI|nr:SET domain-containing protein [Choiromyces venosus 120613-1]